MSDFVHLHLHNEYSVLDGVGTSKQYVYRAKELGQTFLAISNHGNCDGVLDHQKQCKVAGIKPIAGCELYVVPDMHIKTKGEKRYHATVLVENQTGWKNLLKLLTIANLEGFYHRPRVDLETLALHLEGLVLMTGCSLSFLNMPGARKHLRGFVDILGPERVYLEVMPHQLKEQQAINEKCLALRKHYGLRLVATNDCHYPSNRAAYYQEVLLAIQSRKKMSDKDRWKFSIDGFYLKSKDEMVEAFKVLGGLSPKQLHESFESTMMIAGLCKKFEVKQQAPALPSIGFFPEGKTDLQKIQEIVQFGFESRILEKEDGWLLRYKGRVEEELALIRNAKFERYFLIVWDLISWCRTNGILTGPGRGSVGGSLVAYLMGITDVDPIKYDLSFSRFISPDRIDLPDIDMDFEDHKRHLVKKYLQDKYGEFNVAGLSTFMAMKGRGVITDVSRVYDIPLAEVKIATKAVDSTVSENQVKEAFETSPECMRFKKKYPEVVEVAEGLEGQIRGVGQHAAAVCVSSVDLREGLNCNLAIRSGQVVANWDKDNAEYMGLIKLDILGLSALSILQSAKEMIQKNHGVEIDFNAIPLDDKKVYREINKGNTVGAFQIGARGLSKFCQQLGVDDFGLLVAATALYRPGPLHSGMAEKFIKIKNGDAPVKKLEGGYDRITEDTFGIIVYQEQVMAIINQMSGIDMATCDKIRKLMAKSKGEEAINKYKQQFLEGCGVNGSCDKRLGNLIWKTLVTFGSYGFNKCLTGDTILTRASGNQYQPAQVTVKELFDAQRSKTEWGAKFRKQGVQVLQMDDDARIRPGKLKNVYYSGQQEVFQITTNSGKSIKATRNHKLLTPEGYEEVSAIEVGSFLLCQGEKEERIKVGPAALGNGKSYSGIGWQKGAGNICFVDGRTEQFRKAKVTVTARSNDKCEICFTPNNGDKHFLEFAHINSLESFNGDYSKYHHYDNIKHLCNSCHKKLDYQIGVRKRRWSKGLPVIVEQVVSIESLGFQRTYDVEMKTEAHNFIANGIVSHNSHSVEYSLITMWDMWLKTYYPGEFIAATLTHGGKDKCPEYLKEAGRLGLEVRLPKIGISHSTDWRIDADRNLFAPFSAVGGIGEATAEAIAKYNPAAQKQHGFFLAAKQVSGKIPGVNKTVIEKLEKMGSFEPVGEISRAERALVKELLV